jgi:hypothetical protein
VLAVAVAAAIVIALGVSSGSHAAPPSGGQPLSRYSIVHGCYSLSSPAGSPIAASDGPFRFQAAALGTYLLYTPNDSYLVPGLTTAQTPTGAAEWVVTGGGQHGFTFTDLADSSSFAATLTPATSCSTYPEAQVDATGNTFSGASPEGSVSGTVEGHAHLTAFDFLGGDWHCGRPWSAFGAPYALPASCDGYEKGTNGVFESFLDFGGLTRPGAMDGWPTFRYWPSPTAIAEEGDYYTGIQRAWMAGLRLLVTNDVDNEALCGLMTVKRTSCNDMQSVRIQAADLNALQDYIDAQSGGPGKGWFRLVTNPFQARAVINEGKLAVIQGIEVSRLFGCGEVNGASQCNQSQVDAGMQQVWNLGVRTFFPVHEFNNAFGGTKGIAGSTGVIVNAGNRLETGSFMTEQPCTAEQQDAEQLATAPTGALAGLLNGPLASLLGGNPLPAYGTGPQCNIQGITSLGTYLIHQMISHHLIIQLDHMDSKTAAAALQITTDAHYAGVVSAHCCSSPQLFRQTYADGGFVTEPVSPAPSFINILKQDQAESSSRYYWGFGYGSDMNGLADQPGPASATPITYPFTSYQGNVTFGKEVWGNRTFNLNTDGLANYGMYADWLHDLQVVGGSQAMADMFRGAEGYLEMWERAWGVPATSCKAARGTFTANGLGAMLHLGETNVAALLSAGQPVSRPGTSYRYCLNGSTAPLTAVFDAHQRIAMIATTAPGYGVAGIRPGERLARLSGAIHRVAPGVFAGPRLAGGARYIVGSSSGRVRFVALAAAGQLPRLRSDLSAAGL